MPKATDTHTTLTPAPDVVRPSPGTPPGRRGLLGGAVALLAGAAAVTLPRAAQAAGTHAALLALCRQFWVHQAVVDAWDAGEVSTEIGEAAHDQWWGCIRAAEEMPAHTIAGVRAKADIA